MLSIHIINRAISYTVGYLQYRKIEKCHDTWHAMHQTLIVMGDLLMGFKEREDEFRGLAVTCPVCLPGTTAKYGGISR